MDLGINWKDIFTISMILFAVIDIVGSIPIIVNLRNKMGHIQSEKATIVAAIIMISFLFVGEEILKLLIWRGLLCQKILQRFKKRRNTIEPNYGRSCYSL